MLAVRFGKYTVDGDGGRTANVLINGASRSIDRTPASELLEPAVFILFFLIAKPVLTAPVSAFATVGCNWAFRPTLGIEARYPLSYASARSDELKLSFRSYACQQMPFGMTVGSGGKAHFTPCPADGKPCLKALIPLIQ